MGTGLLTHGDGIVPAWPAQAGYTFPFALPPVPTRPG